MWHPLLPLLLLLPQFARAQIAPSDIVINEIMYAPTPSTNEFVEIYNRSDTPIPLNRIALADGNRDFTAVASTDSLLGPGNYAVVVRDPEAFRAAYPGVSYVVPGEWSALNNGGDTVYLRTVPSNAIVDSVAYEPEWGGDQGRSLERIDPAGPSNDPENFASSEADRSATPGARNSVYNPDETPPSLETVTPSSAGDTLDVEFSEPLAKSTVVASAFFLEPAGAPAVHSAIRSSSAPNRVICVLSSSLTTGEYTLVASDIEDRRGNRLDRGRASFTYFVPEPPAPGDVVISEILYAPSNPSNEFIEVYNRSEKTIDLGTLHYADSDRDFDALAPPLTALPPEEYAVIARDRDAFTTRFPSVDPLTPDGWDALNNGGDTVILRHRPSQTSIDRVPYQPSWGGTNDRSLERIDPRGPSDAPSNFSSSTAQRGATPAAQNSQHSPDTTPPSATFAEQIGKTEAEVVFNEPVRPASITPDAFTLKTTSVTAATLRSPRIARLTLNEEPSGTTLEIDGVVDVVGNRRRGSTLPFAHRPSTQTLVVNEILYAPRANDFDDRPNQVEYLELHNVGDRPLSMNQLRLTDRPTESGVADTIQIGRRRYLFPGSYAVIAAAPEGESSFSQSQLASAFPESAASSDSIAYLPVDAEQIGLRNDGDLVRIHRRDGTHLIDVSYSPDWHAHGLAETKGTALARISPTAPANDPDNWTSSVAESGGTPGAPNAVSIDPPEDAPPAPGLRIQPDPFSIERDGGTRIHFALRDVPNLVRVRIFDARGREVRTLERARLTGRSGELIWNGRDGAGNRLRIGPYVVLFEAVRAEEGTTTRLKETVVLARPLN